MREKNPDIKTLIISSQGGSEEEAYKIADYVAKNQLRTWVPVNRMCLSACVAILLSGASWQLQGQLGLHSASFFFGDIVRVRALKTAGFELDEILYKNSKSFLKRAHQLAQTGLSWGTIENLILARGHFIESQVVKVLKSSAKNSSADKLKKIRPTISETRI